MAANPYRDNSGGNVPLGPGRVVLHYEVQEQAEFGGFGDVYVARDTRLDREVLLKTLPQNLAGDNKARASFTAAVSTAASLSHPNIAHVFDAGDVDGRPFAVFEPLNGSPLRTSFRDTYPTLGQTLDIVRQICVALQHAHQQGIVHGSLSPDCVWLDGAGWIQVVDFSFVTASTPSPGETRGEALEYRAPESWDGHPPDELTDIYATGLILYELVTGVHPFRRNSADETVQAISGGIVQPAGKYHSGLPESFSRIIERSLERDRHMRYQRVGDMLHDISIEIGGRVMLESEARYRSLNDDVLDSSWVGTCILDSEFRVVWINRALERYFCLRREDVIGEDWPRLIETSVKSLVEGGDDLVRRIRTALTDNAYIERFEFHLLPSERCQERWLEHWSQPIRSGVYAGGRIEHYSDFSDRVQTLMALRESEDKYRSLVVNAADGIAIVQESRITFANPGLAAILGRPVEELVDSPFSEHVHPDDLERCERLYNHQVAHSEGVQQAEVQLLSSGGRRLDTEVSVATVTIKRQPAVLAVVRDVTTRKHSEKLLRLEQERAQRYLNIAATIIVAIDADECVGLINKKGCEVLGLPETEIVGRNWFDSFVPADIRGEVRAGFRQLMNGDTKPMEFYDNPIVNADGEHRLIAWNNTIIRDDDGNIQGTLSSGTDVTDRRRVEDAYRESAATLQSVFLAAPIGIGLVNNRVLGWVNDRLCQMTGYSREELEGQNALKLYETTEEFERVGIVKHGEIRRSGLGTVETRWVRKDGGVMDIILSSSAIDPSDLSRGLVFTALDITARKQTDDMLKKATEHLKREHLALVEKNIALKQVLDHMENDRRGDKDQVATDIEDVLMPIVDRLKRRAEGDIVKDVEALEMSMRRVLSRGDDDFQRRLADLTPREREICDLIREGVSSKDISERLILSVATIHKHREQIRKKLGIANVSVDLRDYLRRT